MKTKLTKVKYPYQNCCSATIVYSEYYDEVESIELKMTDMQEAKINFMALIIYQHIADFCAESYISESFNNYIIEGNQNKHFSVIKTLFDRCYSDRKIDIVFKQTKFYLYNEEEKFLVSFLDYNSVENAFKESLAKLANDFEEGQDIYQLLDSIFICANSLIEKEILSDTVQGTPKKNKFKI